MMEVPIWGTKTGSWKCPTPPAWKSVCKCVIYLCMYMDVYTDTIFMKST